MLLKEDFFRLNVTEKKEVVNKLLDNSAPCYNFCLMFILALIITTLGILIASPAVVIGGMLVAPILYPILGLAMGIVTANFKLIKRAGRLILLMTGSGISISLLVSLLVAGRWVNNEIIARSMPSAVYFFIALVAGVAASYALSKPKLSEAIPGIAIAVALLPPLAVCGVAISLLEWKIFSGALSLFLINIVGIVFASIIVYSLLGFYERRQQIEEKIEKEEKKKTKEEVQQTTEKIEQATEKIDEIKKVLNKEKERINGYHKKQ